MVCERLHELCAPPCLVEQTIKADVLRKALPASISSVESSSCVYRFFGKMATLAEPLSVKNALCSVFSVFFQKFIHMASRQPRNVSRFAYVAPAVVKHLLDIHAFHAVFPFAQAGHVRKWRK